MMLPLASFAVTITGMVAANPPGNALFPLVTPMVTLATVELTAVVDDVVGAAELEEQRGKLRQELDQLQNLLKDHEELKQQLTLRTTERDALQGQFEQFRKGIRSLLGQAEAAVPSTPAQPVSAAVEAAAPGKS